MASGTAVESLRVGAPKLAKEFHKGPAGQKSRDQFPGEGALTRASVREFAAVWRERSQRATRAEKQRLLDEIVGVRGLHQK